MSAFLSKRGRKKKKGTEIEGKKSGEKMNRKRRQVIRYNFILASGTKVGHERVKKMKERKERKRWNERGRKERERCLSEN